MYVRVIYILYVCVLFHSQLQKNYALVHCISYSLHYTPTGGGLGGTADGSPPNTTHTYTHKQTNNNT